MRLRHSRRKSWRKFRKIPHSSPYIRIVCFSALALELAFAVRESAGGDMFRVSRSKDVHTESISPAMETKERYERTSGFQIRLEDGEITFYRKEEFQSTD